MCLAIPGKVIKIEGRQALVQYPQEERAVMVGGTPIKVGEYVLVQMGIILKVISPKEAEISLKAWQEKV